MKKWNDKKKKKIWDSQSDICIECDRVREMEKERGRRRKVTNHKIFNWHTICVFIFYFKHLNKSRYMPNTLFYSEFDEKEWASETENNASHLLIRVFFFFFLQQVAQMD